MVSQPDLGIIHVKIPVYKNKIVTQLKTNMKAYLILYPILPDLSIDLPFAENF
jgi:hypothetical protein